MFRWLRTWTRDAVLAGIADALTVLDPGTDDPAPAADALLRRLGGPQAGADARPRLHVLSAPPDAGGAALAQADGTAADAPPARKGRKAEGRP